MTSRRVLISPIVAFLMIVLVAALFGSIASADPTPDSPWTGSGSGTTTVVLDGLSGTAMLSYNNSGVNITNGSWEFKTTAQSAGTHDLQWTYSGFHSYFNVTAKIDAFVDDGATTTTVNLIDAGPNNCCTTPSAGFSYTGTKTFTVEEGDVYGFRMAGSHYDGTWLMLGQLTIDGVPVETIDADASLDVSTTGADVTETDVFEPPTGSTITGFTRSNVLSSNGGREISSTISEDGSSLTVVSNSGGESHAHDPEHSHDDATHHEPTDHSFTHSGTVDQTVEVTTSHDHSVTHDHTAVAGSVVKSSQTRENVYHQHGYVHYGPHFHRHEDGTGHYHQEPHVHNPIHEHATEAEHHEITDHGFFHWVTKITIDNTPDHSHFAPSSNEGYINGTAAGHLSVCNQYQGCHAYRWNYLYTEGSEVHTEPVHSHTSDAGHATTGNDVHAWTHTSTTTEVQQVTEVHEHTFNHEHSVGSYSTTYVIEIEDNDGIADAVDVAPNAPSDAFSDGTTSGSITSRGDQTITIVDAANSADGVVITAAVGGGSTPATITACDGVSTYTLTSNTQTVAQSITVTCGSAIVEVISGSVLVTFISPDGTETTSILPTGNTLILDTDDFTIIVPESNPNPAFISINGIEVTMWPGDEPLSMEGPIVTAPSDINVEATGPDGAVVNYPNATATDPDGVAGVPVCTPASGSTFDLGPNTVTCTASDDDGNVGTATFEITVQDTTAPVVNPPADQTAEASSVDGAVVNYPAATATDAVGVTSGPTCLPASGTLFAQGTTEVTCTASDNAENEGEATFNVTVADTTDPVINSLSASPDTLSPVNHKMRSVTVSVDATDGIDDAVSCEIAEVNSNEEVDANGSGNTDPDWDVTGDLTLDLRAERSGQDGDRVYTITVVCTDDADNDAESTATVTVPHDQGNGQERPVKSSGKKK